MAYERGDYLELVERQKAERQTSSSQHSVAKLRTIARSAVEAGKLTADPDWDIFLSYLQAVHDEAVANQATAISVLGNPSIWDAEAVQQARFDLLLALRTIDLLDLIMALPADIKRQGEQAQDLLSRMRPGDEKD